jgi:transglutaminase superfamily protein
MKENIFHQGLRAACGMLVAGTIYFSQVRATAVDQPAIGGPPDVVPPATSNLLRSLDTEAVLELKSHLRGTSIDLALVNWLIAADIPEFGDMKRESYFKQLDVLVEQVRREISRMQKVAIGRGENLDAPKTRCAIFCNAIIKLKFAYAEEFRQENITPALMKSLYADPDNICLAGLLRTRRGSCVSMPLIYVVIGQRLGMPVHLVSIGRHYFVRWEEPGFRMNIETTIVDRVAVSPDDSVYLEVEGMKQEQVRGSDLKNLTAREVAGQLLFARSGYWNTKGIEYVRQQRDDLALARELAPDDNGIRNAHAAAFRRADVDVSAPASTGLKTAEKGKSL